MGAATPVDLEQPSAPEKRDGQGIRLYPVM